MFGKKEKDQTILQDKNPERHSLRSRIRELKNAWFQKKAKETGQYSQARTYDPRSRSSYPVRSKYGVLLSDLDEIKGRWVEHFSDLSNLPSDVDFTVVNELDLVQLPMI